MKLIFTKEWCERIAQMESDSDISAGSMPTHMSFVRMLNIVLDPGHCGTLTAAAKGIGISPQYLHDLKEGRRLPSVEVVNKICDWMGRGPEGRLAWHRAGATAHGWEVNRAQKSAPGAEKRARSDDNWQAAPFDGEEGP